MSDWVPTTWGDVVSLEYGKALRDHRGEGAVRVYGSNGPIGWTARALVDGPGVILGRKGAYRGVEYTASPFHVIDTAYYVVPKVPLDLRWLYYAIKYHKLGEIDDGSPIPSTTRAAVSVRGLELPPLEEQVEMTAVLSALDDKIELNRRMNETLEAMAQAIFRDWFVNFGPVRRKLAGATDPVEIMGGVVSDAPLAAELVKAFPSELRGDGAAWEEVPFLSLARLISGGTPKTDRLDYWNGRIAWASAKDVSQCDTAFLVETERAITSVGLAESSTKIVPKYSTVVVARGATTGRFCMFGRDIAMNQTCYGLQSRTDTPFWLNSAFRAMVSNLVQGAHGSVFDTITTTTFENARFVRPSDEALRAFEILVAPIFGRILLAIEESRTLAETRDYLLPRLMSGEVKVGDLSQEIAA